MEMDGHMLAKGSFRLWTNEGKGQTYSKGDG